MPAQSPTLSPTLWSAITAGLPGVVLGDSGLDLADQVGADVGGLGEDVAAETAKIEAGPSASAVSAVDDPAVVRRSVAGSGQVPEQARNC